LLVLTFVVFLMTRASGDPLQLLLPLEATREDHARVARELGLDQPLPSQYAIYLGNMLQGDLGKSLRSGEQVTSVLWQRTAASLQLATAAVILIIVFGIPLGIVGALHRGSRLDTAVRLIALAGQSVPPFWLGIVLIHIFAVSLRWLPSGTNSGPANVILPAVALSSFGVAAVARLVRSSMLDVLDSEFITFMRAKGMPERVVIWKHALRSALLPVVSFTGVLIVGLITLAITVETVFAWPGLGLLTYSAILSRDFPLVQGVALYAGAISILVGLAGDLAAVYLDPRIRLANR
jgi:peptide/nickel transport system permease protein